MVGVTDRGAAQTRAAGASASARLDEPVRPGDTRTSAEVAAADRP
jgi:hypothetical protein